jgi:thiamine kinase-like enzyme
LKEYLFNKTIIVPKSFCHGDLTFTNVLFHKNRLFFIDFLDSYVDSFICDLIKLKQDLYYFWSLKVQNIDSLRIKQIYKFIWDKLYRRYSSYIDSDGFKILDTLNSLRIEPYLTNQYQRDILYKIIENSNLYEKFNRAYGGEVI